MELSSQVTSLELSKKLKELGVKQKSLYKWVDCDGYGKQIVLSEEAINNKGVSAFTVAELLEMSPASTSILKRTDIKTDTIPRYYVETFEHYRDSDWNENPANALAKMLIYLIENKLI